MNLGHPPGQLRTPGPELGQHPPPRIGLFGVGDAAGPTGFEAPASHPVLHSPAEPALVTVKNR